MLITSDTQEAARRFAVVVIVVCVCGFLCVFRGVGVGVEGRFREYVADVCRIYLIKLCRFMTRFKIYQFIE